MEGLLRFALAFDLLAKAVERENSSMESILCAQTMRAQALWISVVVVVGVRIVQCHAIIDVVIDVRVMQCHASMDVVIGVRVVLCHQALNFPVRVQILNLLSCCTNSS